MTILMSDNDFLDAVESARVACFGHHDHLRMAWAILQRDGEARLVDGCRRTITTLAAAHGDHAKYHETRTVAWASLVAAAAHLTGARTFDELLDAHPDLLDPRLLDGYYSPALLTGDEARRTFVAPDLRPLPA